jgi:predicted PurR-regulated permease PerM
LVLGLLGFLGGLLAFGFIGIFLGPTLLAVGYSMFLEWHAAEAQDRGTTIAGRSDPL